MVAEILIWIEGTLLPALELWSGQNGLGIAAALILCVLFGGQFARLTMRLSTASLQGKIALSHLVFFVSGVSLTRCLIDISWVPALQGAIVVLVLWVPSYLLGALSEKAEESVKHIVQDRFAGQGMRTRVLEEMRNKEYDPLVFEVAEAQAGGDKEKLRHCYIGLRSRKLGDIERSKRDNTTPRSFGRNELELKLDGHLSS
ncbi:MAG: hypothetical protein ACSHXK_08490 [Oceanococcus sp.]